jgi:Transglutaminase-like superfamily
MHALQSHGCTRLARNGVRRAVAGLPTTTMKRSRSCRASDGEGHQVDVGAAQSNDGGIADDVIQLRTLRLQAARLRALEEYTQLVQAHPHPPTQTDAPRSSAAARRQRVADGDSKQPSTVPNDIPLLDAALLIARHAHPELDAAAAHATLDALAADVMDVLPPDARQYPLRVVRAINEVLYTRHGFKGNTEDYYNPDNSCINCVLESKKGVLSRSQWMAVWVRISRAW